jgi:hypothetical protein
VTQGGDSQDASGHCSPVVSFFCPKPMVPKWVPYDPTGETSPSGGGTCPDGSPAGPLGECMFLCACPAGSSPPSNETGPGSSTCVCNNGPQAGQPLPGNGVCAPVCQKTLVPVAGGACCAPTQVSACGDCCPAGQTPDATTGQCASNFKPVRPPPRLLNR